MSCQHDNCFTCPYPDCISGDGPVKKKKGKPGRKKLPPEVLKQNRQRYSHDYYRDKKEQCAASSHEYYLKHREEIKQKQKEKRLSVPHENIWVTNGKVNKRIRASELKEYQENGYCRGRTSKKKENK